MAIPSKYGARNTPPSASIAINTTARQCFLCQHLASSTFSAHSLRERDVHMHCGTYRRTALARAEDWTSLLFLRHGASLWHRQWRTSAAFWGANASPPPPHLSAPHLAAARFAHLRARLPPPTYFPAYAHTAHSHKALISLCSPAVRAGVPLFSRMKAPRGSSIACLGLAPCLDNFNHFVW